MQEGGEVMRKLVSVDGKVVKILDEIREERNCSYSKAIELLAVENEKTDRILRRIGEDFRYYKQEMPNIERELELIRIIVVWLYKIRTNKERKETAENVRKDLEKIISIIVEKAREHTERVEKNITISTLKV